MMPAIYPCWRDVGDLSSILRFWRPRTEVWGPAGTGDRNRVVWDLAILFALCLMNQQSTLSLESH